MSTRSRILIIDDEDLLARGMQKILGSAHETILAHDGRDALELLRADHAFDAIFCDLALPGISGMELYEQARALEPKIAGRFVFLTGGAFTDDVRRFLARV